MALPATESFTNSDGTALPTHNSSWTENSGSMIINSNSVASDSTSSAVVRWNADTFDDDQYSQAKLVAMTSSGSGRIGLSTRCDIGGAETCYWGYLRDFDGANKRRIGKVIAGTKTFLTSDSISPVINEIYRLESVGTSLEFFKDGASILSLIDATIPSGAAGLWADNTAVTTKRLDDWEGGNLAAPSASIMNQLQYSNLGSDLYNGTLQ